MKNLRVTQTQDLNLESHINGYCFELDRHLIYALDDSGQLLKVPVGITPTYNKDRTLVSIEQLKDVTPGCVRLIEFIVEASGILIVLKEGKLLLVSVDEGICDCIYTHHTEISSASLSPAQDSILIADEQNGLKLMPFPFSVCSQVYQSNALTHNKSLHKPVGVGWGSKETQFFGLDGRPSQETKQKKMTSSISDANDNSVTTQVESSEDFVAFLESRARTTSIAWRGDGQLISTLTAIPESNKHYLKVWNKRLELQYMSEQLVDIENGLMSYIPNGQFLCCAQRRDQQVNEVLLFEKNGLVRDRITLPQLKDVHIKAMSWSPDSAILAIIAKQFRYEDSKLTSTSLLFLYTMQNWHYYLKFTSRLSNDDYSMSWHPNNITTLQIMSDSGHYIEYNCISYVDYSLDCSTVAVLDANKVLITPLQCCAIPPPYSAIQLETNSPIRAVAIDYSDANNLVILTLDNQLILTSDSTSYCCDAAFKVIADEKVINSQVKDLYNNYQKSTVYDFPDGQALQNLTLLGDSTLVASRTTPNGSELVLVLFSSEKPYILVKANFPSQQIISISRFRKFSLLITLDGNSSVIWSLGTDKFKWINSSGEMSQNIFVVDSQVLPSTNSVITLNQDLCLRVDQKVILFNSCTSFRITDNYLVFTTNENTLNFILLEKLIQQSEFESWSQTIENGGILITANEVDFKVVLQMPRGNLEILHPRILIFSALTKLIDAGENVQACKLARRHRVNMNFLVDYIMCLSRSCENLNQFALEISKCDPNLLCLIITELDNLSTISGRYKDLMKHLPTGRKVNLEREKKQSETQCELDKVNRFCSSIKFPTDLKYLNPKLQSLLKMEPKRMTEALKTVYELDNESKVKALKFILYFEDIDQLFLDALCTYDTNITLMVASASNKDPKQYLAFLDKLNEIENDNFRFFTIDMHVKHYKEAFDHLLGYLQVAEDSNKVQAQLIDLVVSKRIYQHAIEVLEDHRQYDNLSELIWAKYANYLFEKRYYTEASVAFSKAQSYSSGTEYLSLASRITSLTDEWESLIALIARSKVESHLKENLLKKISDQLSDRGKFYESLMILDSSKVSLSDTLLSSMLNRGQWYLAEFIANQDSRSSMRMKVKNSVLDTFSERITSWTEELSFAQEQLSKLKTLMLASQSRQFDAEGCYISDTLSTVDGSETSSLTSGSGVKKVTRSGITSIKTRSSIKSNKPQNKRITMKPGSRHEDIALILELQKFMLRQKPHQDEAMTILATLYEYAPFNTARSSSTAMKNLLSSSLTFSQEASEELWPSSLNLDQKYSLYERVKGYKNYEVCENVDFEILIKPKLPKSLISFEL